MNNRIRACVSRERLAAFFGGNAYPVLVCALVLLGHITGLELYLGAVNVLLVCAGLLLRPGIKPLLPFALTFLYQISRRNVRGTPADLSYYFGTWRIGIVVLLAGILIGTLGWCIRQKKLYKNLSFRYTPLLLSLSVLSAAFLTNGLFSPDYRPASTLYGAAQIFFYLFLFLLFFRGMQEEPPEERRALPSYIAYISMLTALLLLGELFWLYLTGDVIVDGRVVKESVNLGWGIWNPVGFSLTVLIPMQFYGVMKNRCPWLYFATATLTCLGAALTLSRNALLFSALTYGVCVLLCCFVGEHKCPFRLVTLAGVLLCAAGFVLLHKKIFAVLADYLERGLSDNGRFQLWKSGIECFLHAPVFGAGFYGVVADTFDATEFLPRFSHCTLVQVPASMGVVGIAAYLFYRADTVRLVWRRRSLATGMLAFSVLILLGMSLLDVFAFCFYPMIYANMALAAIAVQEPKSAQMPPLPLAA